MPNLFLRRMEQKCEEEKTGIGGDTFTPQVPPK